jgi:hypothetical protein
MMGLLGLPVMDRAPAPQLKAVSRHLMRLLGVKNLYEYKVDTPLVMVLLIKRCEVDCLE